MIKDDRDELWFYRHSDGYPSGNLPQLRRFLDYVKNGAIRGNVEQASGWLIIIGAQEYLYSLMREIRGVKSYPSEEEIKKFPFSEVIPVKGMMSWKVGAYEPCSCREIHGDVEWLYTIDLVSRKITIKEIYTGKEIVDDPSKTPEQMEKLF